MPENVQISTDEEQAAASLFREVPPTKGNPCLPEISTTIPIPVETTNTLTHETIVSITKTHYFKENVNVNESRCSWETTYSHHSCFMIPDDFSSRQLISKCVHLLLNFIYIVMTFPIICSISVVLISNENHMIFVDSTTFLHCTPFVLQ